MGKRTFVPVLSLMIVAAAALCMGVGGGSAGGAPGTETPNATQPVNSDPFGRATMAHFTENRGQVSNSDVLYYIRSGSVQVGFTKGAILLKLTEPLGSDAPRPDANVLIRTSFEGSNFVSPEARKVLPHRSNFFRGKDPEAWRSGVRNYREVVYTGIYDGIDLVYRATPKGLKYDFIVHPGADPSRIVIAQEGIEGLDLTPKGEMVLHTALGELRDAAPSASQGSGDDVACRFVARSPKSYGFELGEWDRSRTLVIDPLIYSTYVGGGGSESGYSIALDASGNAYVTGYANSTDFPTTPGAYDPVGTHPLSDVIVFKLDSAGSSLIYSTYVGGADTERGEDIAVGPGGEVVVTGSTKSADFPTTAGAFDETHNGSYDAFVLRLDPTGSALEYSTFIGGSPSSGGGGGGRGKKGGGGGDSGGYDHARAIALDSSGDPVISGTTSSSDFPTTSGAYDTTYNDGGDVFVCRLSADGSFLLFSTFLGDSGLENGYDVALDTAGDIYVAGATGSKNFPTTDGAYDTTSNRGTDAFLTKMDSSGSFLIYSTFLGGRKNDKALGVAVDASGEAIVAGWTRSPNFPTTPGAYQTSIGGGDWDVFVTKLDASGSALVWSTYLGGSEHEAVGYYTSDPLALDSAGRAVVTGWTTSTDFPTTAGAFDTTLGGSSDAFVTALSLDGASLVYSTFLGGSESDGGKALVLDALDDVFVTGNTNSTDYPTTPGAFSEIHGGGSTDCFVTKLSMN
ncbi:MAG: SBBP repeat-containing protein [Planctomycetota bacterium]|nr:SBBP repeat-containing protein [Planctomycetota bacterium]